MSGEGLPDLPLPDFASLVRGSFTYFPVVPGRMEFAAAVRETILSTRPAVVAVELPATIQWEYYKAVARLPKMTALVYPDPIDDEKNIYVVVEPTDPFTEAIRSAQEVGAEVRFIDAGEGERPHLPDDYPDTVAVSLIGVDRYIEAYRVEPQRRNDEVTAFAQRIAWKLQGADPLRPTLVVLSLNLLDPVLDAMEQPQEAPTRRYRAAEAMLVHPAPEGLAEICVEHPYQQARYEQWRATRENPALIHRGHTQFALFKDAESSYQQNTGDRIESWHRRYLARYSRNLASVSGYLSATLFELTVAARSIVDDNYAWEVWNTANLYAAQQDADGLEVVNLSADEIWLNTRKMRIRRRLPRPKQRLRPANLKMRRQEKRPGEWAEQLNGDSICSYPPEDLVIEDYGRFLKKKAKSLLGVERSRVHPFTTSILDGIDIRETIRNWHRGKIFVKEEERLQGDVGAVVVVFDEDLDHRYHYLTTWLGENQNESDMAFYSTHPFDHLVGPGIGRAEYGGFLMTLPARRLFDVWADPDYDFAESKSERLLMAALDYSVEKHVVYVAAKPPRSIFRSIAAQLNRKIVYIPIGQLNPMKLKRVRVVHILDSHARRDEAKEFVW